MQSHESSNGMNMETPDETGLITLEIVDLTEICHFEICSLLSNEKLADYLREMLPLSHLEGCHSIQYDPGNPYFSEHPEVLAFFDPDSHEIKVGPEERQEGQEGMLDTLVHEIGHNVHQNILEHDPEKAKQWISLYEEGVGFVSDYASTDQYEDFAESYMTYVRDPEFLQFINPEKYTFMRDEVFAGQEYPLKTSQV